MPVTSTSLPPSGSATRDSRNSTSSSRARDVTVGDVDESDAQAQKQRLASVLKDRTADGGAVTKTVSSSLGDTCTWYANQDCSVARTCYDCLNTKLAGDKASSCMVNNYGVCVTMSESKPDTDFRRARPPNVAGTNGNQYPSVNATYCAPDDKYCAICRTTWNNPFDDSQLSYLPFCRGTGGCVCIQMCESPYRNDNVILQRCRAWGPSASVSTVYTSIGFMAALCCVVAVVTFCVRRWMIRSSAHSRPGAFRHDLRLPQREPTGPRLGLSGWRSMREKLIQTEREQLQLTADNQALAVPVVDLPTATDPLEMDQGYFSVTTPSPMSQLQEPRAEEDGDKDDPQRRRAAGASEQPAETADQDGSSRSIVVSATTEL